MSFDLFPNEQSAALLNAARHPASGPEAGTWDGFASGAGQFAMRSLAETARAVDMAGAVFPIAYDAVTGGTTQQDRYFREHDDVLNGAVDYWTPRPGEVGTAGQIAGQLAGGVMQAVISPAVLVGTAQLSSAEDLVRDGVDAGAANVVGDVQGLSAAVGLRLPFLGKTLATRVLSGAGGNLVQGTAGAAASSEVLKAGGYDEQAARFNPWDLRARALDAMLGAAFGGMAHLEARLTPTDQAALLVANQARHIEDSTISGRPASNADTTLHVDAMRQAVDQVLRGEPVTVDAFTKDLRMVPDPALYEQRLEVTEEARKFAEQEAPPVAPIVPKAQAPSAEPVALDLDPAALKARRIAQEQPDLSIPTDRFDAEGNPVTVSAADAIAHADAELAYASNVAPNLFKAAAHCLLGAL